MDILEVALAHGLLVDQTWHRAARLQPLSRHDEVFHFDEAERLRPAARVTALLARCLHSIGPLHPVTPDHVRSLTIGDREALLLHLRRLTFGDRLTSILACPACAEKMDLDLSVSDLLVPPGADPQPTYETTVPDANSHYRVRFRLPTGADQEQAALTALEDPSAATAVLLQSCVERITGPDGQALDTISDPVATALSALMAELDPQAELLLDLTCPACDARFTAPFDAADYLFRELAARGRELFREVHTLALHYHWSESEILALSPRKRRLYLDLLAEPLVASAAR